MLGKIESKEKRVDEDDMVNISHSTDMNFRGSQKTEEPGVLQSMGLQRIRHDLETEQQQCICRRLYIAFILKTFYLIT